MKVQVIGGGPGGLYFALLAKKQFPAAEICVSERNARGTTFGWGVVFSDETLSHFANADLPSYEAITANFIRWDAIEIFYNQTCERSEGHGFCGISRKKLIELLTERCESLGVTVDFDCAVQEIEQLRKDVDLVVAADGVRSAIRETYAETFQPDILDGKARYIWLGTPLKLDAFTFFIENTPHGVFQAHAYPFQDGCSTFIIECTEDTWLAAGLDRGETQDQLDYLQEVFATALAGSPLWSHGSSWIHFKRVKNQRWFHENVALLGDAAHTAHFSIGSGTKLAMEDAIALVQAPPGRARPPQGVTDPLPLIAEGQSDLDEIAGQDIPLGGRLLRLISDFDTEVSSGKSWGEALIGLGVKLLEQVNHRNLQGL